MKGNQDMLKIHELNQYIPTAATTGKSADVETILAALAGRIRIAGGRRSSFWLTVTSYQLDIEIFVNEQIKMDNICNIEWVVLIILRITHSSI